MFGNNGNNFINTMMKLSENHRELRVVVDQIGSPTYTVDLAKLSSVPLCSCWCACSCEMILTDKYGIYHASNEGYVSWADFAREIFKLANIDINIIDVTTEEYNATAMRPKNSRLDKSKLIEMGFDRLPDWKDALKRYMIGKGWLK